MVACTHEELPQPPNGEHPIIAVVAIISIIAAMLLITWARVELHGTRDIEAAFNQNWMMTGGVVARMKPVCAAEEM